MAFEFREEVTLELPAIEDQIEAVFAEGTESNHGLIVELASIHAGTTANFNTYSTNTLTESIDSWVSPFPKPILRHHDQMSEPVGRVMAAKMDKEADGTPFIRLQVAITDTDAAKKVLDQRYLTGSIGGKAEEAKCSICQADWANASMFSLPCKHSRGKTYKGKVATIEMGNIKFVEYSFVNSPADSRSGTRAILVGNQGEAENDDDGWIRTARVFDLNMDKEEIVEFTESTSRDVLAGMKRKDAAPLYLQLKGAFLSALAVSESEYTDTDLGDEADDDDILAVTDELSSDLSLPATAATEADEADEVADEIAADENADDAGPNGDEPAEDEEDEDEPAEADEGDDGDKPEGQSKPTGDVDADTSAGAPKDREEDETDTTDEAELDGQEDSETDPQLVEALESRAVAAESQVETLLEENAKLKAALKRNLAERVVDTKIMLGLADKDQRDELLTEHTDRTARSLADSLRDLATMEPRQKTNGYENIPKVGEESLAVGEETNAITIGLDDIVDHQDEVTPEQAFEDIVVEAMMGRRKL